MSRPEISVPFTQLVGNEWRCYRCVLGDHFWSVYFMKNSIFLFTNISWTWFYNDTTEFDCIFLSQIFPKHSWKWFYFFNSLDQWLWEYAIGTKKPVTRKCYFICSSRASYPRKAMYISQKLTYPQKADMRGFSDCQIVCQTLKRKKNVCQHTKWWPK